jgi:hypothetical protein
VRASLPLCAAINRDRRRTAAAPPASRHCTLLRGSQHDCCASFAPLPRGGGSRRRLPRISPTEPAAGISAWHPCKTHKRRLHEPSP